MRNAHRQRAKRREYARSCTPPEEFRCPNCGEMTFVGHYVPASFGDPGLWTCEPRWAMRNGGAAWIGILAG